jgi:hypothetical protein
MALDGGSPSGGSFDDEAASSTIDDAMDALTNENGTWIRWERLISVAVGFLSTVWFGSIADFIGSVVQAFAIGPVTAVGDVLGDGVTALLGAIPISIRGSFRPAAEFIRDAGPFAFLIAVGIITVTAYVVAQGLNRDG